MALRRYNRSAVLKGGTHYGTANAAKIIKDAVDSGTLKCTVRVVQSGERLDTIAGEVYNNGLLWWVIAASSGIGWGLQVPAGTRLLVPLELSKVAELVG